MRVRHFGEPMAGETGPMPWVAFADSAEQPEEVAAVDLPEDEDDFCPNLKPKEDR